MSQSKHRDEKHIFDDEAEVHKKNAGRRKHSRINKESYDEYGIEEDDPYYEEYERFLK